MLKVGGTVQQVFDLLYGQDIGKFEFPSRVEGTWHYIAHSKDILVKEATGLRHHATLIITRAKLLFDEIEIPDDVVLIDVSGILLVIKREDVTHLGSVITHRSGRVILSRQIGRCFQ